GSTEIDATALVIARDLLHRAMEIDRLVVSGVAEQRDQALRLAERVGADEVGPLREQRDGMQELADLGIRVAVAKYRQTKSGLGGEHVAGNELQRNAGRIGDVLVVAGSNDPAAARFDRDLRGAEHVPGRMEGHSRAVERDGFAITDRLRRAGEAFAVAQPHEI